MEQPATSNRQPSSGTPTGGVAKNKVEMVDGAIVEIVSDSGEGAQTAGQMFGTICAKMGNGIWTVEIIPAEIEPPSRSREGASGNRVRFGMTQMTNMGDEADVAIAFNEQVLYSRIDQGALKKGTMLLLNDYWKSHQIQQIREDYAAAVADFRQRGYDIHEVPMTAETLKHTDNPRRGQNMWVVGMLCALFSRDVNIALNEVTTVFTKKNKGQKIIDMNHALINSGYQWGLDNLKKRYSTPEVAEMPDMIVTNGNAAVGLGACAAGFEICSMYPITPATSASHYLASIFNDAGGFVHQAEDEIAAVAFAIGASYAGKTALTITSGPGMALKTEMIGLASMSEVPLVIVDVQRGGPSTGLPTKVEQGDLLHSVYGHPGDTPKIVMAPATIEECFHFMIMARKLSETFRIPVIVLTDANLATGQCAYPYPTPQEDWLSPPIDQSAWPKGVRPYEWDEETGLSRRPIPGMKDGGYVLTGLAHDQHSHIAYASAMNQYSMALRSKKLQTIRASLTTPKVFGEPEGDMLVVGWGSTQGAIEEAVARFQKKGKKVSSLHLRFLSPWEPGIVEIMQRYKKVMTVEINYSDEPTAGDDRRYAQLAMMLRAYTLLDIDCWSLVPGQPLPPGMIEKAIATRLEGGA